MSQPSLSQKLAFSDPIPFIDVAAIDSMFQDDKGKDLKKSGIYLWAIRKDDKYYVNYVAMAQDIPDRLKSHIGFFLSGGYMIHAPENLRDLNNTVPLYKSFIGGKNLERFLPRLPAIAYDIKRLFEPMEVFVAPLPADNDVLYTIEWALIDRLKDKPGGEILDNERRGSRKLQGEGEVQLVFSKGIHVEGLMNSLSWNF